MAKKKHSTLNTIYAMSLGGVGIAVILYFIFSLSTRLAMSQPISPMTPESVPYAFEPDTK